MQHLQLATFGERDREYLSADPFSRIRLLEAGSADLFDAFRREPSKDDLEVAVGRVICRTFCIANGAHISVVNGMMRKFPLQGCVNCQSIPCICTAIRPDAVLGAANTEQQDWTLSQWQQHLDTLYTAANSAPNRGIWFAIARLTIETNELRAEEALRKQKTAVELRNSYELEVADTLAWTLAIANLVGIDAQSSYLKRFGNGCPTCQQKKCICEDHSFQPVKFG